ncbi:MAG TPA: carboxypeptidase regulatory-like domain-containing protein [Roseiflexaceae bacterium]|nr:carboxypeptidase regulatory-like domain-containing protein [Roseiflexaceae bacterium]
MRRLGTVAVLAGLLCLLWGIGALPGPAAAQGLPPRPTLTPVSQREEGGEDREPAPGRIAGTVIDLTTGAPAPGVSVTVGDRTVTTDANGNYDISGLPPGTYRIALSLPEGRGTPAQEPLTVELLPGGTVIQHLAFRSPSAPPPTAVAGAPAVLPRTAGPEPSSTPLVLGLALLALGTGLLATARQAA